MLLGLTLVVKDKELGLGPSATNNHTYPLLPVLPGTHLLPLSRIHKVNVVDLSERERPV